VQTPEPLPAETLALIARTGSGDRRAAEDLIACYRQRVARFVIAQTGDETHYEDLCQSIFVKMMLGLSRLRSAERFEPWLYQIARNVCRDHLRARSGWRRLFVPYGPAHEAIAAPESAPDPADGLDKSIERLPEAQRTLLRLSLENRTSYEELARQSHSSVASVKARLYRARENLRTLLLAGDAE
jgi:RNA polymerase sigma-70 factor (ECF subfamily)